MGIIFATVGILRSVILHDAGDRLFEVVSSTQHDPEECPSPRKMHFNKTQLALL